MKRIAAILISLVMIFSACPLGISAADNVFDPYGSSSFGPASPEIESNYYTLGRVTEVTKSENSLLIKCLYTYYSYKLTVVFPKTGGVRLYGEEQGNFGTDDVYTVNYRDISDSCFDVTAVGGDGTTVRFTRLESSFTLDFYNSDGKAVTSFDSADQQLGINSQGKINAVRLNFPISEDEVIYGTGERFSGLNQNGKRTIMWNTDCAYHGQDSVNAELWRGYKNVPILHSNAGYTFFYDSYYSAKVDIGYTDSKICTMDFSSPELDLYIWTGTPLENLNNYTSLTGKSIVLPKWAYSYIAGAGTNYWFSNGRTLSAVKGTVQQVMDNFANLGTPDIAAIYLEGITDERNFNASAQSELYNILKSTGTRMLQWNRPDVEGSSVVSLLDSSEIPILKDSVGNNSGSFIDFTDSRASKVMSEWLKPYLSLGLKGGLLDFGELIQPNTVFSDGTTGYEGHNKFAVMYAKGYYDTFYNSMGDDFITLSRAGAAGSQSYTAFFSGDQSADFRGLRLQLSAGLSAGASGFAMWGGDMAGYEGKPTNEVFCRGLQLSAFSPIMRAHGTQTRFPWDFGAEGERVYKKYYWLRENLIDSIYSSAVQAGINGAPMMQALVTAYPEQKEIAKTEDTYIFCDEILVSPVLESATKKTVVFPDGNWYDLYNGAVVNGGAEISVDAPLDTAPAYLKSGAVLPVTLAKSLKLCDPIDYSQAVKALIITPPDEQRKKTVYAENAESTEYISDVTVSGYSLRAADGNTAEAVIAYGTDPIGVTVDGKALAKINPATDGSGYYTDENGVTVIKIGTADWNLLEINEQARGIYTKVWDFSDEQQLEDFDAYMNDGVYGYEKQAFSLRWDYVREQSLLREKAWMCKEGAQEAGRWGGSIPDSASALTPKGVELENFEASVKFKLSASSGLGTVAIGFRETVPGRHTASLGNWDNFGRQDNGAVSGLACAAADNVIWLYSDGAKLSEGSASSAGFYDDFYTLRIRTVGNECRLYIYDERDKLLYDKAATLPAAIAKSGAISCYATNDCLLKEISITALDGNGIPYDYFGLTGNSYDLSKESTLDSFDAYMNDSVYGYERQSVLFRWSQSEDGISANRKMCSQENPDTFRDGGVICSSISSITPKGIDLRNFETQVKFKVKNYESYWGAVAVGFREIWSGKHADIAGKGDSWNFGLQGDGCCSTLVSAISKNELWVDSAGVKLLDKTGIASDFTAESYILKVRAVENECTVSLYDGSNEGLLYTQTVTLSDKSAARGAITYYATNESTISEITITALDGNGNVAGLTHYSDGDVNRDGYVNSADLIEIRNSLFNETAKYGYDVNKDCSIGIRDLVKLKKLTAK